MRDNYTPRDFISDTLYQRSRNFTYKSFWQQLHIDPTLLLELFILTCFGLIILYSASGKDLDSLIRQASRLLLAFVAMFIFAQIPPKTYKKATSSIYVIGVLLLIATLIMGKIGKGAQRWLDLGIIRFQPSEILKLAMPMMLAKYLGDNPMPPKLSHVIIATVLLLLPGLLIIKQPDLGTALMVIFSGACTILFAGISWRIVASLIGMVGISGPVLWHFLHDYQKQRIFTFINPEQDPLGTGYHIIQSKIAIGSGGLFGKGLFNGSQSHLNFLPEHTTDFIFAVCGEELGLFGGVLLVSLYLLILIRGFYIAAEASDNFSRLLAASLSMMFFLSVFVNIGMVIGILPVVGIPLPLVSFGGTSMVTVLASFGILMSIHTHRTLMKN